LKLSLETIPERSEALSLSGHGGLVTYLHKVLIALTKLCREVCHYYAFAETPCETPAYFAADQVLTIARAGVAAGCREALFALGDQPQRRYLHKCQDLDVVVFARAAVAHGL